MKNLQRTLSVVALSLAAGCGGGGGGSAAIPPAGIAAVPATSSSSAPAVGGGATVATSTGSTNPNVVTFPGSSPRQPASFAVGAMRVVQVMRAGTAAATGTIDVYPSFPVTPGNLLVAGIAMDDGSESIIEQPSGWPPVDRVAYGSNRVGLAVFTHVVTAADANGPFHFIARLTSASAPQASVSLTGVIFEVANANTSSPVNAHATWNGYGANSASSPSVGPNVDGSLPLAFLTQISNGSAPANYSGPSSWNGIYNVAFSTHYGIASEGLAMTSPTSGSSPISVTETYSNNDGPEVSELVMISPGNGSTPTAPPSVPQPPSAPSTPTPTQAPSAPSSGPNHVHTMVMYHGKNENTGVPAGTLVNYADMVETDEDPSYGNNFMNAGGKIAMVYSDPFLVPFCDTSNHCPGTMGQTPESGWLHDPYGNRLRTQQGQDALNPNAPATQSSYYNYTHALVGSNRWTNVLMDDTGGDYDPNYMTYKFGYVPQEYANLSNPAATWLGGDEYLATQAARPVIFNGGENDSNVASFLASANVSGRMVEGCVVYEGGRTDLTTGNPAHTWIPTLNKLLMATNTGRYAICENNNSGVGDVQSDRLYVLASEWLVYDPNYSVFFPDFDLGDSYGGYAVRTFAESTLVPTQPVQSPGNDVSNLKNGSGTYVREYEACYQNGNLLGACAAVANPDRYNSHAVAGLTRSYSRSLTLSTQSAINGGSANWVSGTPSSLAPTSGAILLQ